MGVIRPDIEKILTLTEQEFSVWYERTKGVTEDLLGKYRVFGEIPVLDFSEPMVTGRFFTVMKGHIEALEHGLTNLEKTKNLYDKIHHTGIE
ncbi:MAG: hypothetical protein AABW50_00910 [Nanoarchaeota archaeon]